MPCAASFPRLCLAALVLLATLPAARAAGDADAGRRVFARCANCHSVGPAARSTFGPHLQGVIGRRAGALADYGYSPALRQAGFTWDEARLRAFIKAPGDVVPGTRMRLWGLRDDRQIDDLLAFLRQAAATR